MTSTLRFWIVCLIVLLFLIWFIRKLLGKIIIICVVLFLLVLIWRWISPSTVSNVLGWFKDIPVRATNYINTEILNKDIVLPLHDQVTGIKENLTEGVEDLSENPDNEKNVEEEIVVKKDEEPRYSWFAKLFKKDKSSSVEEVLIDDTNEEIDSNATEDIDSNTDEDDSPKQFIENRQQETIELKFSENGEIIVETTTKSGEKIADTVAQIGSGTVKDSEKENEVKEETTKVVKENTGNKVNEPENTIKKVEKEENEVVYIKSNPKKPETVPTTNQSSTTKSVRGLSTAEVREANEIFN